MFKHILQSWRQKMIRYEADYRRFARRRGFKTFNDFAYHRRGFLECWAEPGFHHFWRVWNPGIAYFTYRIFIRFGGRRRWLLPVFFSFVAMGIIHTLVVWPFFGYWSYSVIGAFSCFAVLAISSRMLAPVLQQEKWPKIINAALNITCVILSFDAGFRLDRWLS